MRLIIPIVIFFAAILWFSYTAIIKGDRKMAMEIAKPTLFFGLIWGIIYLLTFKGDNSPQQMEVSRIPAGKAMQDTSGSFNHPIFIVTGEKFLWKSGLCLKANEESTFLIPGAVFPQNIPIGDILKLSDTNTEIEWLSDPRKSSNPLPDFKITLKTGSTIKINRNTEVILTLETDSIKRKKAFTIVEGSMEESSGASRAE